MNHLDSRVSLTTMKVASEEMAAQPSVITIYFDLSHGEREVHQPIQFCIWVGELELQLSGQIEFELNSVAFLPHPSHIYSIPHMKAMT